MMKERLTKCCLGIIAAAMIWGLSISLFPSTTPSAHAQSINGFTPAVGTITIGSHVFPVVPHRQTSLRHTSSRRSALSLSPSYASCSSGGYWIDMGDNYTSGGGHEADAIVYGLYNSPDQTGQYCGEVYCFGDAFADAHQAPVDPASLLCTTNNDGPDQYDCSLPSGGLNGSVCGQESRTYYNVNWGDASEVVSWYTTADTGQRWG